MTYVILGSISILSIIGIIILCIKLHKKEEFNIYERDRYNKQIQEAEQTLRSLTNSVIEKQNQASFLSDSISSLQEKYAQAVNRRAADLDQYFANQKELRQSEMDTEFERQERERKESLDLRMKDFTRQAQERVNQAEVIAQEEIEKLKKAQQEIADVTLHQEERFEALLQPLQQYEKERQERLFYTIQVPDEYKDDIDFLITTVSQKVQHPDIINKLVWAEYVKPYIDETFKRVGIKDETGIYKITNLDSGKCYIGKSTNIKKRLTDHFKSSIGIKTIADQAVHHEIWKTGFWNWSIEPIIYCDKDELNDLEKYYIDFFKSQEFGYNKNSGGGG